MPCLSGSARPQGGVSADGKAHDLSADLPEDQQPGILRKRMETCRAGDGMPAPENAGRGVQIEHRECEMNMRGVAQGVERRPDVGVSH